MKKTINVLLLGISGNVTQGMISVLNKSNLDVKLIGGCIFEDTIGKYMVDKFYLFPYADDKTFINTLVNVCNNEKIDIVLSGVEENIYAMAKNIDRLQQQTKAQFPIATIEQLKIGNDKLLTCEWLKENKCNYPKFAPLEDDELVEELISDVSYPLIAKPKKGKGSCGIYIINKREDLSSIKEKDAYVLEEMLGDKDSEYTVALYYNKYGIFQNLIIMKRKLKNGTTVMAEVVENKEIYDECKKIADNFKIKGPLNIQLRMHKNKPTCFELNVRFSGTTPIRNLLGYKDLIACIKEYCLNDEIKNEFNFQKGKVIRTTTEILVENKYE